MTMNYERTDEANFQGGFNGFPGQREEQKQFSEHTIISSILTNEQHCTDPPLNL